VIAITQLRDEVEKLKKQLKEKDQGLIEKEKKVTMLILNSLRTEIFGEKSENAFFPRKWLNKKTKRVCFLSGNIT
jgi:hypothetical protein